MFETVGKVVVLAEDQIDELGTVSGSGPAYVFFLIEKFMQRNPPEHSQGMHI